jgi:hypothetical protein
MLMSTVATCVAGVIVAGPIAAQLLHERAQRRASEPRPIVVTDREQQDIVRRLLAERSRFYVRPIDEKGRLLPEVEPGQMVLLETSVVLCDPASPERKPSPECHTPPSFFSIAAVEYDADIPRKLRIELVHANFGSSQMPDPGLPDVILRPRAPIQALVLSDVWQSFFRAYPGADGYIEFTRAVRSEDGQHALIYEQRFCHGACFSGGDLHYFIWSDSGWRLIATAGVWVS